MCGFESFGAAYDSLITDAVQALFVWTLSNSIIQLTSLQFSFIINSTIPSYLHFFSTYDLFGSLPQPCGRQIHVPSP